jgi:hypothetical protein
MTTLNLSHVTVTLQTLLRNNCRRLLGGTPANDPQVTLMPPELVTANTRTLNLHLYHVSEDPHYRNDVGMAGGVPPVSGKPMALRLFYVMTAHLTRVNQFDAESQQHLLGLGMKTFHDNPVVNDSLIILPTPASPPVPVMHAELLGNNNRIEILPRNLEPEENMSFWATEDQRTPRMAVFYEVRTVFLSPEEVRSAAGTVFDIGLYVSSSAAARLRGSRSVLGFQMPASTGLGAQAIDVTPARATLRALAVPDRPRLRLTGHNLTAGDTQLLQIIHGGNTHLLDPALNADWDIRFATSEISLIPQATLDVDDGAGGVVTHPVPAGFVSFALSVRSYRYQGGTRLNADYPAGQVQVSLGAHIDGSAGPAGGFFTVDVDPVVDLTVGTVTLAVAGEYYTNAAPAPAPTGPGTFVVTAAQVVFQPAFPAPFSGAHPVQLFVDGAESQPYWIEVP